MSTYAYAYSNMLMYAGMPMAACMLTCLYGYVRVSICRRTWECVRPRACVWTSGEQTAGCLTNGAPRGRRRACLSGSHESRDAWRSRREIGRRMLIKYTGLGANGARVGHNGHASAP